nr:DPP IV N-terminal domain-containing protein [Kofleriaceae bacterium]
MTTTTPTWPALDAQLLADAAATFNFRLGQPAPLRITRDGAVLFRRTPPREFVADLYELDPATGAVKTLATARELLGAQADAEQLTDAEKARRERTRTVTRGIVDIDVSRDGRVVLVPLDNKLFLIDRTTGARTTIDPGGEASDPRLSPDGTRVAFVRDGDLWLVAPGTPAKRLTQHPEGFQYATAEFVAQEELHRTRGYWWSPDGKQLAFQRSDLRPVDTIYVADARHNDKPPVPFKYPRAGTANAVVDLGMISADGGAPTWLPWDSKYSYLVAIEWPDNAPLTALVSNREQTDCAVLALDRTAWRPLLTEHDDAWLNYDADAPRWLDDGSGWLWATEQHGDAWTLELRDKTGALVRTLTTPEFGLRSIAGVDATSAIVVASADPTRADLWRVPLAGGAPQRLTDNDGVSGGFAKHGVVVVSDASQTGPRTFAIAAGGHRAELPSVADRPHLVPTTVLEQVQIGGRTHHVAITRPRAFDPQRRYPVLLKVYAGPHAQMVTVARDGYVMDQWYADAGFIVVRADGRGTPNRGRAWERAVLGDLITVPLADQVDALHAVAARHHELDLSRVGVFGWSFGGYFSAMAVLLRPDVFHAAVAGAPVTDWALYDSAYTERYMRTPQTNADGYSRTSAVAHASQLTRPLLIVHGITDDNVHFAHTLALVEALYVAGKRAEVITLSATHMVPDPKLNLAREQVQIDFFREKL